MCKGQTSWREGRRSPELGQALAQGARGGAVQGGPPWTGASLWKQVSVAGRFVHGQTPALPPRASAGRQMSRMGHVAQAGANTGRRQAPRLTAPTVGVTAPLMGLGHCSSSDRHMTAAHVSRCTCAPGRPPRATSCPGPASLSCGSTSWTQGKAVGPSDAQTQRQHDTPTKPGWCVTKDRDQSPF